MFECVCLRFSIKIKRATHACFLANICEIETHKICVWALYAPFKHYPWQNGNIFLFFLVSVAFHFVPLHFYSFSLSIAYYFSISIIGLGVCVISLPVYIWTWTLHGTRVLDFTHYVYFHTECNVAAVVVFSVYRLLFLCSKGRETKRWNVSTNICGISICVRMRAGVYLWTQYSSNWTPNRWILNRKLPQK